MVTFFAPTSFIIFMCRTPCHTWTRSTFLITHTSYNLSIWWIRCVVGQGATQGTAASANRQSTLEPAALVHTVLMHGHLLQSGHTHTHKQDPQKTYIARKWAGQELRDEILQTAQGGWGAYWSSCTHNTHTQRHMHRHLHGGPLQTHSTACTALSENATVYFSEECLSIQKGYRQSHTQMEGIYLYSD